jgi:cobalamin synthase
VNALFESVARSIKNLGEQLMFPRMRFLPKLTLLGVAAVSAFLMAKGLAGEELLETLIRTVLLMWLGKYGLITIYLFFQTPQTGGSKQGKPSKRNRIQLLVTATITLGGILVLALIDDQPMLIFTIMALSICTVLVFGGIHRLRMNRSR